MNVLELEKMQLKELVDAVNLLMKMTNDAFKRMEKLEEIIRSFESKKDVLGELNHD